MRWLLTTTQNGPTEYCPDFYKSCELARAGAEQRNIPATSHSDYAITRCLSRWRKKDFSHSGPSLRVDIEWELARRSRRLNKLCPLLDCCCLQIEFFSSLQAQGSLLLASPSPVTFEIRPSSIRKQPISTRTQRNQSFPALKPSCQSHAIHSPLERI